MLSVRLGELEPRLSQVEGDIRRLQAIATLAAKTGAARNLPEVTEAVCAVLKQLLGCEQVHVFVSKQGCDSEEACWEDAASTTTEAFIAGFAKDVAWGESTVSKTRVDSSSWPARFESVLAMPILHTGATKLGALVCVNKKGAAGGFGPEDEQDIRVVCQNCWGAICMARSLLCAQRESDKHKAMINLMKKVTETDMPMALLLETVATTAKTLVEADRVRLFVVCDVTYSLLCLDNGIVVEVPIGAGVAGRVAETGETLNIKHADDDEACKLLTAHDKMTDCYTKSVLCMPIIDHSRTCSTGAGRGTVAVLQCMNSHNGHFTADDEAMLNEVFLCMQGVLQKLQEAARVQTADDATHEMLSQLYGHLPREKKLFGARQTSKSFGAPTQEQEALKARTRKLWSKLRANAKTIGMFSAMGKQKSEIDWSYHVLDHSPDNLVSGINLMLNEFGLVAKLSLPSEELSAFIHEIKDGYRVENH
jgi:GAF domain-containing protein